MAHASEGASMPSTRATATKACDSLPAGTGDAGACFSGHPRRWYSLGRITHSPGDLENLDSRDHAPGRPAPCVSSARHVNLAISGPRLAHPIASLLEHYIE
ncbi:hypothetical protein VDGL01_11502 [Verticillium dahliae]